MSRIAARSLAILTLAVLAVVALAGPATAHRMHISTLIAESGAQQTLVNRMSADIMRVALKIDDAGSIVRLRDARVQFDRTLSSMRRGNAELIDSGNDRIAPIVRTLSEAGRQWAQFSDALSPALDRGSMTAAEARELLALNRTLADTLDRIHTHYRNVANHYGVVTVIGMAIMATERERALGQKITADLLVVALGAGPTERVALIDSADRFAGLLTALAEGDPAQGLIPAPTAELRQQWTAIEGTWAQIVPYIEAAAVGERFQRWQIDEFAALAAQLEAELDRAADMLTSLVPGGRS